MKQLTDIYVKMTGKEPSRIEKLPGAGSNRQYYRLYADSGESVIGVVGTSKEENHAFIYLSKHFSEKGLPMPEVYAVGDDEMCYLQQDLGNQSLYDALREGRNQGGEYSEEEITLLQKTIRLLPKIQVQGAEGLDFRNCYPLQEFNEQSVHFDLNYFKYCFLKFLGIDFNEVKLEEAFNKLAEDLLSESGEYFMYRDFQARNVMLDGEGCPCFIDFQGGRKGPYYYDLASFLWQASAKYSQQLRDRLIAEYYSELKKYTPVPSEDSFRSRLRLFVLFRILQVLGAYGFRGYYEKKKYFIDSIVPAIDNLRELLREESFPYPYLVELLTELTELPRFKTKKNDAEKPDSLVVRVFSFSYKRGIPEDESGNGGGYVFDCRSTNNPGRYAEYRQLTGLDEPVIRFLEEDGEILTFLESVYKLADKHVERYIERGFTDLMFSFGCTGGQHRSVYSAQHLAEYLHKKYGIEVRLCHREQNIKEVFK